jgi:hypothetical protein
MTLDFDFEHDFNSISMSATIRVTCKILTSHGSYDEPASIEAFDINAIVMCGKVNVTDAIDKCTDQSAQKELEDVVNDMIWERYEF